MFTNVRITRIYGRFLWLGWLLPIIFFPLLDAKSLSARSHSCQENAEEVCPFEMGTIGCPMAHCDPQMTDNTQQLVPNVDFNVHADTEMGSFMGLGCVSNGTRAACSFNRDMDAIIAYDFNGNRLWSSGKRINQTAFASAPIIDKYGYVIAADNRHIVRFDDLGNVVWRALMPGNGTFVPPTPISPVPNGNGCVLVGTKQGPVSTFNPTGRRSAIDSKWVSYNTSNQIFLSSEKPAYNMFYHVDNTPAFNIAGTRTYITMSKVRWPKQGALVALDVDEQGRLSLAWWYSFQSPSGASPLVVEDVGAHCGPDHNQACGPVIYFDGRYDYAGIEVAEVHAVEDRGPSGDLLWDRPHRIEPPPATTINLPVALETCECVENFYPWLDCSLLPLSYFKLPKSIDASFTADPDNGCMWYYANTWAEGDPSIGKFHDPYLRCLSYEDGTETKAVRPGCLVSEDSCFEYTPGGLVMRALDRKDVDEDGKPDSVLIFNMIGLKISDGGLSSNKIVAVRLLPEKDTGGQEPFQLLWSYDMAPLSFCGEKSSQGQLPIFANPLNPSDTRTIFSTNDDGIYVIGKKIEIK